MNPVVIIGAGVGGLVAACELARHGREVLVLERAAGSGGKLRSIAVDGVPIDAGPTVFTMRPLFESIFAAAGRRLTDDLDLAPFDVLARHAWHDGPTLDLHADCARTEAAIGAFAGAREAAAYRRFHADARAILRTLEPSYLHAQRPTPVSLAWRLGWRRLPELWRIRPFARLWGALGDYFHDPRLRQLFGRYATYVGSSPFAAPATLMLIAAVEQAGVWRIVGGMRRLSEALEGLARAQGVRFRHGCEVRAITSVGGQVSGVELVSGERIAAATVIANADIAALAEGRFGTAASRGARPMPRGARSLSAVTWVMRARAQGFPLHHHTVFFSRDYAAEFRQLFSDRQVPQDPTIYVCAQDRGDADGSENTRESLFCLINSPADGDARVHDASSREALTRRLRERLAVNGLTLDIDAMTMTTPDDFNTLFPATGGALYGRSQHGWRASFQRPGARGGLAGLYYAGGSTHPGAGLPMASLSGRLAAQCVVADSGTPWQAAPAADDGLG